MRIYISGPITGTEDFAERFEDAAAIIAERGHKYINPAKLAEVIPDASWDQYLETDYTLMQFAEAITMLPGWEQSRGARKEYAWAIVLGLPTYDLDTGEIIPCDD